MALAVEYAPGVALSAVVAAIGYVTAPFVAHVAPIPNMVIALVVGIALNPLAARSAMQPGMAFCVRTVLRWAVALLGLRVGLADIAALATLAMLVYPPLCLLLGFDAQTTGVMLGDTIHDVAQVVGAGYAVSVPVGNTAVIVKLFRVFLLPVVLGMGWHFTRMGQKHGAARCRCRCSASCSWHCAP